MTLSFKSDRHQRNDTNQGKAYTESHPWTEPIDEGNRLQLW